MTAQNGGSAFLLLYLVIVLLAGVPALLGELVIGRRAKRNPVTALSSLSDSRAWRIGGLVFSIGTTVVLLSFYSVVGGWIVRYFIDSFSGAYLGSPAEYFSKIDFGMAAFAAQAVFLIATAVIVIGGIQRGIELATKLMVPTIAVLLVSLALWAGMLPGSGGGYNFYLQFDWVYLQNNFLTVLNAAAGQALFTLSVGAGGMITYASYLDEDRSLPVDAATIGILNVALGVLVGLVVFPLQFAIGVEPGSGGPGALFVSLAGAFSKLPSGAVLSSLFYAVVLLAALSSSINMLEVVVSFLIDEFGVDRRRATLGLTGMFVLTGGVNAYVQGVFEFLAFTLINLLLYLGITSFLLFCAWVLGKQAIEEYTTSGGPVADATAPLWLAGVGVVIPLFLIFTTLSVILPLFNVHLQPAWVIGLSGIMITVLIGQLRRPGLFA